MSEEHRTEPQVHTLYKFMILYMLEKAGDPLTSSQLSEFIVEKGYTSFFHFQEALNELSDSGFLNATKSRSKSQYTLTKEGQEAIRLFAARIPGNIKMDILSYLKENKVSFRREIDIRADYGRQTNGEYIVSLEIRDRGALMLRLDLNVVTKDQAILVCDRWHRRNEEVYQQVMDTLLFEK